MLVLSRTIEESIYIGDGLIKVQVLAVKGRQVKIGIEAPKSVSIHREEVFKRLKAKQSDKLVAPEEVVAE